MIHITSVNLKEFRGIRECKEPLKLKKFNVLVGRNNSGKSALLQALSVLPHPEIGQPMDMRLGGIQRTELLSYLTGGDSSIVYKYTGKAELIFYINSLQYEITLSERRQYTAKVGESRVDWCQAIAGLNISQEESKNWSVFIPNDSEFLEKVCKILSDKWPAVVKTKSHIKITREIINPTVDETFTEVIREDSALKVRKEVRGEPFYVNVRDLGDGVEKALCISLFLNLCNPQLVLWDDFEAFAHPSLLRTLLDWLSNKKWQVVLATHSIDTLYELAEIKPEEAQLIQLKKTVDDILIHKILTIEELSDQLSTGIDPRLLVDQIA